LRKKKRFTFVEQEARKSDGLGSYQGPTVPRRLSSSSSSSFPYSSSLSEAGALMRIMEDYLEVNRTTATSDSELEVFKILQIDELAKFFRRQKFRAFDVVYDRGEAADKVFFIEDGIVETVVLTGEEKQQRIERINKISAGGVFGSDTFLLNLPRPHRALAICDCVIWFIDKEQLAQMEVNNPRLCILTQHVLLKSMALLANSSKSLYPTEGDCNIMY
jgi:CRP-like cAMP-binding protein